MSRFCSLLAGFVVLLLSNTTVLAQGQQQQLASQQFRLGSGIIRVAEPGELADTVAIWGDVRQPGVYLVRQGATINDLISYSGGPIVTGTGESTIDWARYRFEITLLSTRMLQGEKKFERLTFRYNEVPDGRLYSTKLGTWDQVTVQLRRRPNFRDYVLFISPLLTSIVTTLVILDRFQQ